MVRSAIGAWFGCARLDHRRTLGPTVGFTAGVRSRKILTDHRRAGAGALQRFSRVDMLTAQNATVLRPSFAQPNRQRARIDIADRDNLLVAQPAGKTLCGAPGTG